MFGDDHFGAPAAIQSEIVLTCAALRQVLPLQLSGMRAIISSAPLFLQVAFAVRTESKKLPAVLFGTTNVVPLQCITLVGIAVVSTPYKSGEGVLKLTCILAALWHMPAAQLLVMMAET